MPRSADPQPELALQGSLFGEPEPPQPPAASELSSSSDLSDAALGADAAARPRQRQAQPAPADQGQPDSGGDDSSDDDQPAWAHHSQVDPQQLTPMLRHYVELKAAHPERVLLYRLGDFFECFFEDAITLSRCWNSPSPAKRAARPSGGCPWPASPITPLSGTAVS